MEFDFWNLLDKGFTLTFAIFVLVIIFQIQKLWLGKNGKLWELSTNHVALVQNTIKSNAEVVEATKDTTKGINETTILLRELCDMHKSQESFFSTVKVNQKLDILHQKINTLTKCGSLILQCIDKTKNSQSCDDEIHQLVGILENMEHHQWPS